MHGARTRHATEVVAGEIHEHHVLGRFLRVGEQGLFIGQVFRRRRTARQRARDRPQRRTAAVQAHQRLGRRADDREVVELEIEHVRRRVEQPHRPVHLERLHVGAAAEQHREHDLVDVARRDVFLAGIHAVREFRLAEARRRRRYLHVRPGRRDRTPQAVDDLAAQRLALRIRAVVQQRDAARQVVEDEEGGRCRKGGVRDVRLRFGIARQPFEQSHHIVARHANQPARERQPLDFGLRPRCALERIAQRTKVLVLRGRPRPALAVDTEPASVHANFERVAETEERIAGEALAALDALQQEARPERRELQKRRYRCIEVGGYVERFLHVAPLSFAARDPLLRFLTSTVVARLGARPATANKKSPSRRGRRRASGFPLLS